MKVILFILFLPITLPYYIIKKLIELFRRKNIELPDDIRQFRIYVAGAQYKNDDGSDRQQYIKKCKPGEELLLVPAPSKYDEYGIQIYRKTGECIGWVPAKYSYEFTTEIERGVNIRAFFHSRIKPNKEYDFYGGRVTIIKY